MWGDAVKDEMKKESIKCICGKWTKPQILKIEGLRIRGSVCPKCKETYLNGEDAMMLSEFRKLKDSVVEGKVAVSGNSYNIRLPIGLVRALGMKKGDKVNIQVKGPKEIIVNVG